MIGVFIGSHKNDGIKLDPRTEILLLIILNTIVIGSTSEYSMLLIAFIPFILFLSLNIKKGITFLLIYILFLFAVKNELLNFNIILNSLLYGFFNLFLKLSPGICLGAYILKTTTVSEFITAMEKVRISRKFIIPLSVMFRFFPTIYYEVKSINAAMKMRGIYFGSKKFFKNPISLIEYKLVPLIISIVTIGEELSSAAMTRGLSVTGFRSSYCKIGFEIIDYIFIIYGIIVLFISF